MQFIFLNIIKKNKHIELLAYPLIYLSRLEKIKQTSQIIWGKL